MLTPKQIQDAREVTGHWNFASTEPFARAIESAATAPLLERIAELERQLEQAREDALEEARQACMSQIGSVSMFVTSRECVANNTAVKDCVNAIAAIQAEVKP